MAFVVALWIVCTWMSSQASVASDHSGCTNSTCDLKEYEHHSADADAALMMQKRRVMMTTTMTTKEPPKTDGWKGRRFRRHHRHRRPFWPWFRRRYGQGTTMTTTVVSGGTATTTVVSGGTTMATTVVSGVCSGNLGGGVQQASVVAANIGNGLATFDFDLTSEKSSCCLSSSGNSVDPVFMKGVNQDSQMVGLTYFLDSPESPNQLLLAANEAPGADFDFNVSTSVFNGEKVSGIWTLRVSISPATASVGFSALDGRITLKIDQCPPSPSTSATGTSTTGPSTSTAALPTCQGNQTIQNLAAAGITIGPAAPLAPGTATNTTIIFNTNLPCSFNAGSVLLDLGDQKVVHLEESPDHLDGFERVQIQHLARFAVDLGNPGLSIDVTFAVESAMVDPNLRLFLQGGGVTVQCGNVASSVNGVIVYTGTCLVDSGATSDTFLLIVETTQRAVISVESGIVPELEFIVIAPLATTPANEPSSTMAAPESSTSSSPKTTSTTSRAGSTMAAPESTTSSSPKTTTSTPLDCQFQTLVWQNSEVNGSVVGPAVDEGPVNTSIFLNVKGGCCASTVDFVALLVQFQQEYDFAFGMYAKSPRGTERKLVSVPTPSSFPDGLLPVSVPQGNWNAYVAAASNDCFCGEQLSGDWEAKFETSKSGSLLVFPGGPDFDIAPTIIFGNAGQCDPCNPKSGIFNESVCCEKHPSRCQPCEPNSLRPGSEEDCNPCKPGPAFDCNQCSEPEPLCNPCNPLVQAFDCNLCSEPICDPCDPGAVNYDPTDPSCPDSSGPCDPFDPFCFPCENPPCGEEDPCLLDPCNCLFTCECGFTPACDFPDFPDFGDVDCEIDPLGPSCDGGIFIFGGKGHGKGNNTSNGIHRSHRSHRNLTDSLNCKTYSRAWNASKAKKLHFIHHAARAFANSTHVTNRTAQAQDAK